MKESVYRQKKRQAKRIVRESKNQVWRRNVGDSCVGDSRAKKKKCKRIKSVEKGEGVEYRGVKE